MPKARPDRRSQNIGNILALEHLNVSVPDQGIATWFYVSGMGFTRDPYVDFGPFNVWINVGAQQFHLPTNKPQILRGHVGVVVPDLDALETRLKRVGRRLGDTRFGFKRLKQRIDVTCPWGNRIRCELPRGFVAPLGIQYVELEVPKGTTPGISRFYQSVMGAPTVLSKELATVRIGRGQALRFREVSKPQPVYDGHHIAIYIADFSGPYEKLMARRLITEESDAHQYRFQAIFDPETGEPLFELEHEVRSLYHPMYARNLTNRNPAQSFGTYVPGRDAFVP